MISKALIDSTTSHEELILKDNVLEELHDMKEQIKNSKNKEKSKLYKSNAIFLFKI